MHLSLKIFLPVVFILLLTTPFVSAQTGILNADPDFDNYVADPAGPWQTFKISNPGPRIWHSPKGGEGGPSGAGNGGPALWLNQDVPFDGGVYQVVTVTPGKGYHFEVAWAAVSYNGGGLPNDIGKVARQTGIDTYGGINPLASTVVWSGEHRDGSHLGVPGLQLDQYARNNKLTIFLRAKSEFTGGHVDVYFDHAVLTENTGMGTIVIAPPTAVAAPATATRTRTQTVPRVAQAPGATSTLPSTATLEPTSTVTDTPRPLPSRTPRVTATPEETSEASGSSGIFIILLALGGLGVGAVALLGFGFIMFRLLGRR